MIIWTLLNLGKIINLMTPPPPLDLILERLEIRKIMNFGTLTLRTLRIAKISL